MWSSTFCASIVTNKTPNEQNPVAAAMQLYRQAVVWPWLALSTTSRQVNIVKHLELVEAAEGTVHFSTTCESSHHSWFGAAVFVAAAPMVKSVRHQEDDVASKLLQMHKQTS